MSETAPALAFVRTLLPDAIEVSASAAESAPDGTGAYILLVELDHPLSFDLRRKPVVIGPGCYAYAGSAHGPGGMRARLARHFRCGKQVHWHIDRLTLAARAITAFAMPGGKECDLGDRLGASGTFSHAHPGFGSSDCRHCRSHLLRWTG